MKTVSYKDPYDKIPVVIQVEDDDAEGFEEVIHFLNDNARIIDNLERKERNHTAYHIEGLVYEGMEYASDEDVESDVTRAEIEQMIDAWLRENLTVVQYRRLLCYGKPKCEIKSELYNINNSSFSNEWLANNSVLMEMGYNVNATDNLSDLERHRILADTLNLGIMSKNKIIDYITMFIDLHKHAEKNMTAINKWSSDIEFVKNYKVIGEDSFVDSIKIYDSN